LAVDSIVEKDQAERGDLSSYHGAIAGGL